LAKSNLYEYFGQYSFNLLITSTAEGIQELYINIL